MRGVIETYDQQKGVGQIRTKEGVLYAFERSILLRRSKMPGVGKRIVFRLKNGKVSRAAVVSDKQQEGSTWDLVAMIFELLLYIPAP